jgi:hypothetical protein
MAIRSKAPHLPKIENSISVLPDSGYTARWVQWHKSESWHAQGGTEGRRGGVLPVVAGASHSCNKEGSKLGQEVKKSPKMEGERGGFPRRSGRDARATSG